MNSILNKINPAVDKKFLLVLAGVIWSVVGIILCNLAANWLTQTSAHNALLLGLAGLALALLIYHFGFLQLVKKNSQRILAHRDKICIFAFQPWKSYLILIIMVGLGVTLRHSALPKPYLSIIYIGFGVAMLLSSLKYLWIFLKTTGKL